MPQPGPQTPLADFGVSQQRGPFAGKGQPTLPDILPLAFLRPGGGLVRLKPVVLKSSHAPTLAQAGGRFQPSSWRSGGPTERRLGPAFTVAGGAEEVANPASVQPAGCDDPVANDDPAVSAPNRHAVEAAAADDPDQPVSVGAVGRAVQFGGVEVRTPPLDPGGGIGRVSHAEAVAIADVAHDPGEGVARAAGQPAFAGIGPGGGPETAGLRRRSEDLSIGTGWRGAGEGSKPRSRRERKVGRRALRGGAKETAVTSTPTRAPTPEPHPRCAQSPTLVHAALDDQTLLALMLRRTEPDADPERLAAFLLDRFGSLGAVAGATPGELARASSAGADVTAQLKLLRELAIRLAREDASRRPVITSWTALLAYVRAALVNEPCEQFRALYLDRRNILLRDELVAVGTVDHAPVYPREVIRRALELSASALILVHNHPSGNPTPSQADIDMTRQIVEAARVFNLQVHDHLVVGREGTASFKALGLI